ncbi:MAG: phosphatase PAP2 family protein [Magnetospirillum sp.]|nr:phosphatase PAP2 family protein [Magnetospirillum sp.]
MRALDALVRLWEQAGDRITLIWEELAGFRSFTAGQAARTARHPRRWATLYCTLVIVLGYFAFDRPLAGWAKAHVTGEAEGFWKIVTNLGLGGVWLVPSGLLALGLILSSLAASNLAEKARLRALAWVPGFLFLAVALSGIANTIIKVLIGRTRPVLLFEKGLYGFEPLTRAYATNSFPSGHSQAAFAAMMALTLIFPRYDIAFIAVAVLVAASRVLTSVHFLSDAVMGAWLGAMVTLALHSLLKRKGIDVRVRPQRDRKLAE